jgi:uncharacterized protein YaiI (UPF0178 family)
VKLWVDADACPKVIKEILYRAAQRVQIPLTLVANHPLQVPRSPLIRSLQVAAGLDVADNYLVQNCRPGDIVVTADIPLAAELVASDVIAINPRGERYHAENIMQRLAMRDFMQQMRDSGQASGGPPPLDNTDRQAFANTLDRLLAKRLQ